MYHFVHGKSDEMDIIVKRVIFETENFVEGDKFEF